MARIPANVTLTFDIDLLDQYKQIEMAHRPFTDCSHDRAKFWVDRVGKLKGIDEVCDSHMVWVRGRVSARSYEAAKKEIDQLLQRINTLHEAYMKRPKRYREYEY